jgi:opacity protein-like surface antigen
MLWGSSVQNQKSVDWHGTVRGRFGYLVAPTLLVYGTDGLAYGGVAVRTSITQQWGGNEYGPSLISPGAAGNISETRLGWTLGGGREWLFLQNWNVKVEYLYYNLGNVRFASSRPKLITSDFQQFEIDPPGAPIPERGRLVGYARKIDRRFLTRSSHVRSHRRGWPIQLA